MAGKGTGFRGRLSLNYVFTAAFSALFVVFMLLTSFSYFQLNNVKTALDSTSKEAIPTIIAFDNIANKSAELVFYTEQLSSALTPPALRLAQRRITLKIQEISTLLGDAKVDEIVLKEYEALQYELNELSALVESRLEAKNTAAIAERQVYIMFDKAREMVASHSIKDQQILANWFDHFSRLTISAGSLTGFSKLNEIRGAKLSINSIYAQILQLTLTLPSKLSSDVTAFNQRFSQIVLAKNGLIDTRVLQLRIEGRTNGRGNFTEKLVSDFARSLNFKSSIINEQILRNAKKEEEKISLQIKLVTLFFAVSIVLFVLIAWMLRLRVINRLVLLNKQVSEATNSSKLTITSTEDEITDIAKTFVSYVKTIEEQQKDLSLLAMQDGLTSIPNRRSFDKELISNYNLAVRHNQPLSILIIDVDYFKTYNDTYGHGKGDEALIEIAGVLQSTLKRDVDFVARYGGEEFVCLLPSCGLDGALAIAEKLRKAVSNLKIKHSQSTIGDYITISVGGATAVDFTNIEITPEALLELADRALYMAKERGRNLVKIVNYDQ